MNDEVDVAEYDGPERRSNPGHSLKWIISVTTLAAILVSLGIAWGTATAQLNHKVDAVEQQRTDDAQNLKDATLQAEVEAMTGQLQALRPQLDRIENRVSLIYCSDIPVSHRTGCQ